MIRGVREFVLSNPLRNYERHAGHFSSAVSLARALAFLDVAHSTRSLSEIKERVWNVTPTTSQRASFNTSLRDTVIPHLINDGLIQLDASGQRILQVMPYPISSKLYVFNNFLNNAKLFEEQQNHFDIINRVQDFPELTDTLEANSPRRYLFSRDYNALESVDVIRSHSISGRTFTFAKSYITGDKSLDTWKTVLDTTDVVRVGLRDLLVLQGECGGFITQNEIAEATGKNHRLVNRLIRHMDNMGLAQKTRTLQMEDALSRPTSGTLLNMNYYEYNNAAATLCLVRSVPESIGILVKLEKQGTLTEEELIDEYEIPVVQQVRNTLDLIGLISKDAQSEGIIQIAPNKNGKEFLSDVLTVAAKSRKVTDPEYDIKNKLASMFEKIDEQKLEREAIQVKLDFFNAEAEELRK
ncbi:hypothetical protein Metfor_0286 [Methanoregula formicica SMSP]|uniref:Uncharacterized protein n=2 Tax=Methanoregula formicica TaxID=882104 RepID=L0HC33_METFS|nr:hypothetical protein Metfor_0286 [Methanoregula formicica SMSP]